LPDSLGHTPNQRLVIRGSLAAFLLAGFTGSQLTSTGLRYTFGHFQFFHNLLASSLAAPELIRLTCLTQRARS
jgi:hypothetical protein